MRRWVLRLLVGGIIGTGATLIAAEASGQQRFSLGRWEAEVEVGGELDRQQTRTEGAPGTESTRIRVEERLGIRTTGAFVVDPRLITSSFGGRFGLFQQQERFDGRNISRNGTLLGYSFDSVILSDKPYSFTLFANRDQNVLSREFGGRTEVSFENRGATFRLREDSFLQGLGFRNFSSVVGARQELAKEDTSVLGQTFRRDERRNVLSYEASKGFQTSDLNLRYEFTDLEDPENPLGNFRSHSATLGYSLDFGPTLNRRWDSRLQYFDRRGPSPTTFLTADEELRVDHYENLFTDYRYLFSRFDAGAAGTTMTHHGVALLQHQLWKSLTTRLTADGVLQDLPSGQRIRYGGDVDLAYRRRLARGGEVFAAAGARYQIDDNRLTASLIDVVDEPHVAPSSLGGGAGFTLNNPLVISATIVVVDTRAGSRLPATLGVDFVVIQEGDLTRIIPLASSPVILAGDPLAVSYSFEVAPSLRFSTFSWRGSAGIDFRWIAFSFAHEQSQQQRLSGRDGRFLEDRTIDTARLELRGDWGLLRGLATAMYQNQDSTRLKFATWQFGQFVSFRPPFDLLLSVDLQESFTDFTLPKRRSLTYFGRATVDWFPWPSLFITGFFGTRIFKDSELPTEIIREAGLKARWSFGKLQVAPTLTWSDRERGGTETTDLRADLRVIRRF